MATERHGGRPPFACLAPPQTPRKVPVARLLYLVRMLAAIIQKIWSLPDR